MQTDPNPANYIYDLTTKRLGCLDFGAGRDFDQKFLDGYIEIIHGSYLGNRDKVIQFSKKLGFLTGEENKEMVNAHF